MKKRSIANLSFGIGYSTAVFSRIECNGISLSKIRLNKKTEKIYRLYSIIYFLLIRRMLK